jgi:predicted dehydrogenase
MSDRLRIGFLGCGGFAHRHAQNLQALAAEIEMVAFCNRTITKAADFAKQYSQGQAAIFSHHRPMLEQVPLDALVISLPPYAHSDEVELAAQRGIHVFIEKPIALSSEDGWRMVAAAEEAGIQTQVGFHLRFGAAVERLKDLIDSGQAGRLGLMSARYFCNSLHAPWWRDREKSGGQLVEQVIHMVDLMRYVMGDPVSVYSRLENLFHQQQPDYTVEDVSATVYGFPDRGIGIIYASNGAIPNRWINDFQLVTQHITADFASANQATFAFTTEADRPPEQIDADQDMYLREMQDFLQAIRNGGQTRTPLREGAKALDMALAAVRSAESSGEIRLTWNR